MAPYVLYSTMLLQQYKSLLAFLSAGWSLFKRWLNHHSCKIDGCFFIPPSNRYTLARYVCVYLRKQQQTRVMCMDEHVTCITVTLANEGVCKQPGVLVCLPCFHLMSQNHPTCQRNSPYLKLASPNEILICYYEHSWCLKRCLWAGDLKALNALNLQTNGFQAEWNWMYPLKWRYPGRKWNLTICLQPMTSVQPSTEDLMADGAFSIGTE